MRSGKRARERKNAILATHLFVAVFFFVAVYVVYVLRCYSLSRFVHFRKSLHSATVSTHRRDIQKRKSKNSSRLSNAACSRIAIGSAGRRRGRATSCWQQRRCPRSTTASAGRFRFSSGGRSARSSCFRHPVTAEPASPSTRRCYRCCAASANSTSAAEASSRSPVATRRRHQRPRPREQIGLRPQEDRCHDEGRV